jgi:Type II secretion system (T2SS), protein N
MMRISIALLWLFVVAVVALFALAPGTWVDRRVAAITEGKIRINDAQGTVWRGRGALGDSRGTWRIPVTWRIGPLALARGALDIEFEPSPAGGGPRGRITLENGSAEVHNVELRAPAAALRTLAPVALPVEAGGEWLLYSPEFRYDGRRAEGVIDVRWDRARLASNGSALDLGTLTAHLVPQGGALAGTLANVGGDAQIDGDVTLAANGATVKANIAAGPGVPPDVARTIAALGTPDANGVVHVQWQIAAR